MKGYSWEVIFPWAARELAEWTEHLVSKLEDDESEVRCHELTRAVKHALEHHPAPEFRLDVADGHFGPAEHSWLIVHCQSGGTCLLDVYAVGRTPMVQLVDVRSILPYRSLYREGPERTDIRHDVIERLIQEMKR